MKVKIKSKVQCFLWCLRNGIIKPHKSFFSRFGKNKKGCHNYFSYRKFKVCGKIFEAKECFCLKDSYDCGGYEFHKDLVVELEAQDA